MRDRDSVCYPKPLDTSSIPPHEAPALALAISRPDAGRGHLVRTDALARTELRFHSTRSRRDSEMRSATTQMQDVIDVSEPLLVARLGELRCKTG